MITGSPKIFKFHTKKQLLDGVTAVIYMGQPNGHIYDDVMIMISNL